MWKVRIVRSQVKSDNERNSIIRKEFESTETVWAKGKKDKKYEKYKENLKGLKRMITNTMTLIRKGIIALQRYQQKKEKIS